MASIIIWDGKVNVFFKKVPACYQENLAKLSTEDQHRTFITRTLVINDTNQLKLILAHLAACGHLIIQISISTSI